MATATATSKCANREEIGKSHDAGVSKFTESILALEPLSHLLSQTSYGDMQGLLDSLHRWLSQPATTGALVTGRVRRA